MDARNPLNIGAAARAMSNFGFRRLRVVNPYDVAFEGARSAVGAAAVLATAEKYETLTEAVADCSLVVGTTAIGHRDLQHPLQRLEVGAPIIRGHLATGPCALLFGSEKFGLSNQDMSHCHWLMHIPTREEHASMNLGQAVAICLYELVRDPAALAEPEKGSAASQPRWNESLRPCSPRSAPAITPSSTPQILFMVRSAVWYAVFICKPATPNSCSACCGRWFGR